MKCLRSLSHFTPSFNKESYLNCFLIERHRARELRMLITSEIVDAQTIKSFRNLAMLKFSDFLKNNSQNQDPLYRTGNYTQYFI